MRIGPCASAGRPPATTPIAVMSAPRAFVVIRAPPRREMEPTTDSIHAFDVSRQRSVHSLRHDRRRPRRPPRPRPLEPALGSVLRDAARRTGRRCDQGGAPRQRRPRAPGRPAPRRRVGAVHDGESQQALDHGGPQDARRPRDRAPSRRARRRRARELAAGGGGAPLVVAIPIADIGTGMFGLVGILAALAHRERTGEGQAVDASLLETPIAWSVYEAAAFFATGEVPRRLGQGHRTNAPYQAFRTADGWLNLGGGSQQFWRAICAVLGVERLADDPRFATPALRVAHREELEALLGPRFLTAPTAVWLEKLEAAGVPAGPILTYDQVFADPQVKAREMAVEVNHPTAGRTRVLGVPVKLSKTPGAVRRPAPTRGQHTDEVLGELGSDATAIPDLRPRRVV